MGLFRRKPSPRKIADDLGPLLVQVAAHECGNFQQAWHREIDDQTQVALFAEFLVLLVAVADRLAFGRFGDPVRSQIMNPVVDTARKCFAKQQHYGSTLEERGLYFEQLFADRFAIFASCSSIMGEGMDSLAFTGGVILPKRSLTICPNHNCRKLFWKPGRSSARQSSH